MSEPRSGEGFRVDQIDHVELLVPDRHQAAAWYGRILGLTILVSYQHWADDPKGPLMISSDGGSTKLALFEGAPQGSRPAAGFQLVAFRTTAAGFETFLSRLPDLDLVDHRGARVTRDSAVDHEESWSLYFCDPFGHHLELTTYEHDQVRLRARDGGGRG